MYIGQNQAIEAARIVYPLVDFINHRDESSAAIYEALIELQGDFIDWAERVEASELERPHILFSKDEFAQMDLAAQAYIDRLEDSRIENGFPEDRPIWECLQYLVGIYQSA